MCLGSYFFADSVHELFAYISTPVCLESLDESISCKVTDKLRRPLTNFVKHNLGILRKVQVFHFSSRVTGS